MEAYLQESGEVFENNFIGCWYPGQCVPQEINLYVPNNCDPYIWHDPNIGSGCSPDQFHKRELIFNLQCDILTIEEAEEIIKSHIELIDKLKQSYQEKWDGHNDVGEWNEELIEELQESLNSQDIQSIIIHWE
jgi:hypothetical protein